MDDIEQAIDEELRKLNMDPSENDSEESEDENFTALDETLHAEELSDSVLAYIEASRNRMNAFEQLILEDIEEEETFNQELHGNHNDNLIDEGASDFIEDPKKGKERTICDIEGQVESRNAETEIPKTLCMDVVIDQDISTESELHLSLEWRELDNRLKEEEKQKLAAQNLERELHLNMEREDEERRRRSLMEFEEQLRRVEEATLHVGAKKEVLYMVDQDELDKQQEFIRKLEIELEKEKKAFEKIQKEERRRTQELHCRAATKIQAAVRGVLVRRWRTRELKRKKEEEKRLEEEKKEWEKIKKEREEERLRIEEEKRCHKEEMERRRVEYEKSKVHERHRLEKQQRLEQQRKKEEKDEERRMEMKRKEEQNNITGVEDRSVKEERKSLVKENCFQKKRKKEKKDEERKMEKKDEQKNITSVVEMSLKEGSQCLEKEKKLEQQRKKDEEDKERRKEMKRREVQNTITSVKDGSVKEESKVLKTEKGLEEQRRKEEEKEDRRKKMKKKEEQRNITSVVEMSLKEGSQCLEKEKRLEQQRKKDEERKEEIKRKEKQKNITCVKESIKTREDVEMGNEEKKEKKEPVRNSRAGEECKTKEENEERGEIANKCNDEDVKDNKERISDGDKDIVMDQERSKMEKMNKSIIVEKSYYQKIQTMSNKDKVESFQDVKQVDGNEELDSLMDPLQSRKNQNVTTATPESCINAHKELSNNHCISLFGSPDATGHLRSQMTQDTDTDKCLNGVEPEMNTRGHQTTTNIELENIGLNIQESNFACLPDSTEQKRLTWIKNCTPWSQLSLLNRKKRASARQQSHKKGARRAKLPSLPPLSTDIIFKTGTWSSLKQVTTVTLEDLPGCSLSTLCQCDKLQTLTLRRCGLRSLDGLNQCSQIRYIDVQENSITHVDCKGLANLQVLLLGKNQLMKIHGLDDAVNLHVLQLSHNNISHISGLGSLKMLLRLLVDHNQLLSTRGLNEIYTLLHLDCSYNHLSHIEGLENCALLNMLDLRGNSLTELPVLNNHVLLRDLYLDDNLISSVHNLESYWLPLLQNLSIAHNSITDLIPLLDLVSLKMLDISQNCLSDLQNVCLNLQGCSGLQELNLTDNPLQQEKNWRSLLLETVPGLIKLNNEQTSGTVAPPKGQTQQWSFQALCQSHQGQRDLLLEQHNLEISSAPSQHDAQLLDSGHHAELFRLAVDQRYAHEYGDSCVSENHAPCATADSSRGDFSETSPSQRGSPEQQLWHTADPQTTQNDFPDCCTKTQSEKKPVQMLNPKIAAVVIQRCWRRYVLRRREGPSGLIAKTNERLNIPKMEDFCVERPELSKSDRAAVVIQAAWRGYDLRRRLALALAGVRIMESDEDFEEVDTDEFIFDEKAMENDWITLHSDASPARAMPYSAHSPLPKPPESPPVFPHHLKHAWSDEGPVQLDQNVSSYVSSRSYTLSERSEKIIKEWGFTNESTALLMLKRANRMKGKKQQQKRLFAHNAPKVKVPMNYKERTYQWLHTQAVHPHTDAPVSGRDHFLPEIDREILNGGRVQLVAGARGRDGVDSGAGFWVSSSGVSPPPNKLTWVRRDSTEHAKTEVPSPNRVSSAPSQKERISFRDTPVRHSGGWGGGKKRTKLNK